MGERPTALEDGTEEELMRWITSANVACGGHAGNKETMEQTIRLAVKHGVGVGAHPGFPDPANFGRLEMSLSPDEIRSTVYEQVRALALVAKKVKADLVHVKPHGALYTVAAKSASVASAISDGVALWSRDLILVGLAHSMMLVVWTNQGFRVAGEAFADRAYEPDGSLRSRKF
ncbi:MAG: LamB/YcsF family protein, partial [Bacteroidota bacterium]